MEPLRVLLVDDHVLFRKGVASLLTSRQDIAVVGEAGDGFEAMILARETMPDVILMDIGMPRCNGLDAVEGIKVTMPDVKIIMLTVSDDDQDLFTAIKHGAEGYLLKDLEPGDLFHLLDVVRTGDVPITGILASKILHEFRLPDREPPQLQEQEHGLTAREIEVLHHVVEGDSNREIAEALSIAENTVKIHLRSILQKLHLNNRIQVAVYAVREGLVETC